MYHIEHTYNMSFDEYNPMGRLNRRFDAMAEELAEMRSHITPNYSRDRRLDVTVYLDKVLTAIRDTQVQMRTVLRSDFNGGANCVQVEPCRSNHMAIGYSEAERRSMNCEGVKEVVKIGFQAGPYQDLDKLLRSDKAEPYRSNHIAIGRRSMNCEGVKVVKIGFQAEPHRSNHIAIGTTEAERKSMSCGGAKSDYGFLASGTPIGVEVDPNRTNHIAIGTSEAERSVMNSPQSVESEAGSTWSGTSFFDTT